jgi:two-component system, LytTR family, sensor histidine kinase AlgZ
MRVYRSQSSHGEYKVSIKHPSNGPPSGFSATPANLMPAARLPNFCNLGIMLRLLIIVNLLSIAAAVVRSNGRDGWEQFLMISAVAQPVIILSLLAFCALRRQLNKLTYWRGVAAIFALEALNGGGFWFLLESMLPFSQPIALWQYAFFFVFATGVVLLYFDLRARSLSPALTEARLQALQARIRPHFLFNTINAVLSLIRAEPKRAERMLEDLSDLFRVLMADNRKLVPLADEITLCRKYLEIEDIRLGERLIATWHIDEMPMGAMVPPLILQPLVENAVYHGIEPHEGIGEVVIDIERTGKHFLIRLTNPYASGSTHVTGNRMAINNIRERLQLHFDAEASLKADVIKDKYVVTIVMPVEKLED